MIGGDFIEAGDGGRSQSKQAAYFDASAERLAPSPATATSFGVVSSPSAAKTQTSAVA